MAQPENAVFDASNYQVIDGTYYKKDTPQEVVKVLERFRKSGRVIRLFLGDPETGSDWLEENHVKGTIGRSMGPIKVPLLIEKGERGGPAISDNRILKIRDVESGKILYEHEKYQEPRFTVRPCPEPGKFTNKKLSIEVLVGQEVHARFESQREAYLWVASML